MPPLIAYHSKFMPVCPNLHLAIITPFQHYAKLMYSSFTACVKLSLRRATFLMQSHQRYETSQKHCFLLCVELEQLSRTTLYAADVR